METHDLTSDQQRLFDGLARLIERHGHERFVNSVLVLPTREYFPEPVPRTVGDLRKLIVTFMCYIGLNSLGVEVRVFDQEAEPDSSPEASVNPVPHRRAAAYFAGIHDGICQFGVSLHTIEDPEALLGALAHEVAHAYRAFHGLQVMCRKTEEELTDLTTVYLGLGVLSTASSYDYKTSGMADAYQATYSVAVRQIGYLAPEDMAFLLGLQCALCGTARNVRHVADHLPSRQRAAFRDALTALSLRREELWALMFPNVLPHEPVSIDEHPRLAQRVLANRPVLLASATDSQLLARPEGEHSDTDTESVAQVKKPRTYRIQSSPAWVGTLLGALGALVLVKLSSLPTGWVLLGAIVGVFCTPAIPLYKCTRCNVRVGRWARTCTSCNLPIIRTIKNKSEATDAWEP